MMSITGRSAGGAISYYLHMEKDAETNPKDDYYSKEGTGEWGGKAAEALGLSGNVSRSDFTALCAGYAPTGEALVQNAGDEDRRSGWDCTFSNIKNVSAIWAVADADTRKQIEAAESRAVESAMTLLQSHAAFTRRGKGGIEQEKADLVYSKFQHGTSREGDPQRHTHVYVQNLAQRQDGTWGSIDSQHLYAWQKAAGATFHATMANEMQKMGFHVERDGEFWKIDGVPAGLTDEWSTRRAQIEAALKESGKSGAAASEIAALSTRKAKGDVTPEQLRELWKEVAAEHGFSSMTIQQMRETELEARAEAEKAAAAEGKTPEQIAQGEAEQIAKQIGAAWAETTEMDAVVKEQQLYNIAAQTLAATGGGTVQDVGKLVADMKTNGGVELHRTEEKIWETGKVQTIEHVRWTTQDMIDKERWILNNSKARAGETAHRLDGKAVDKAINDYQVRKGFALTPDQLATIKHIASTGGVAMVVGDAGTGKSTAAECVKDAYQAAGYEVIGVAPSNKAAVGLKESAQLDSASSVQKLALQLDHGSKTLDSKTVVLVDEAAMLGSRTWHKLQQHADKAGAKLVYIGDHKQLQAVEAGGVFRNLQDAEKGIGAASLTTIMRQKTDEHKTAVQQMGRGEAAKAMDYYIQRGDVHAVQTHKAALKECTQLY
ncbi:MAG: MobF family relaxase [Sulfuricella sp.]